MQKLFNFNNIVFAVFTPALVGLGIAVLGVRYFTQYGLALFAGLPVLVSFLAAFLYAYRRQVGFWRTYGVAMLSILALGGMILMIAMDGLMCLAMALPLAVIMALPGAAMGRHFGAAAGNPGGPVIPLLLCAMLPALMGFEHANPPDPLIREVITSVEVDAPPDAVWDKLVAFSKIPDPPTGVFALGVAYPIEARIEGHGVGALRYCTFSTGSFIEPITEWNEPRQLSFNVISNPPPIRETSIYPRINAPHSHGYMTSKHGQFRLTTLPGGRTLLEGTTWYSHNISPQIYWGPVSDEIIHQIHRRVLNHIKEESEH